MTGKHRKLRFSWLKPVRQLTVADLVCAATGDIKEGTAR